jgi:sterol desaturase/sphingolipid hydroxylase (fatty acid hydroxylase superfamily)
MVNLDSYFLTPNRIHAWVSSVIEDPLPNLSLILVFNSPLVYSFYINTFDWYTIAYAYLFCGLFQGAINGGLYYVSDVCFAGKDINTDEWKKNTLYKTIMLNTDSTYIYILGAASYISLTSVPQSMQWTFVFPGYAEVAIQLSGLFILHDILFTLIHYIVHKVGSLRKDHLKWHHECPLEVGSSRCAVAATGVEALARDLYSAIIPTYIIGLCGLPFYAHLWVPYYSIYSLWAMYIHTGLNTYHRLHHTKNSNRNYGLYYITDYALGTLELNEKKRL